jgi:bacterioferritin (cytochrome b1)
MASAAPTHPRVLGYLGRALSLELSAVQQYMTQASLVELWGLAEAPSASATKPWRRCNTPSALFNRCWPWGWLPPPPS